MSRFRGSAGHGGGGAALAAFAVFLCAALFVGCLSDADRPSENQIALAVSVVFPEELSARRQSLGPAAIEEIEAAAYLVGDTPSFVAAASSRAEFVDGETHFRLELRVPIAPSYRVRVTFSGERGEGEQSSDSGLLFGGETIVSDLRAGETRPVEVRVIDLVPRLSIEAVPPFGERLRWTAVEGAARYTLQIAPPDGRARFVVVTRTDTLMSTPPTLRQVADGGGGEVSIVRVRSESSLGLVSAFSEPVRLTTPATIPPSRVFDLAVTDSTDRSLLLRWTAPGDDGDVGRAVAYDIRYSSAPISEENFSAATAVATPPLPRTAGEPESLTVGGLEPSRFYFLALRARDDADLLGAVSNLTAAQTRAPLDRVRPGRIADLAALAISETEVALSWTAPDDDETGGVGSAATRYVVRRSRSPIQTEIEWGFAETLAEPPLPSPAGSAEQFTATGHQRETTYYYAVRAEDEAGNRARLSNSPGASTLDLTPPAAIADMAFSEINETSVRLSWTAVGDDGSVGRAESYELRRAPFDLTTETNWDAATVLPGLELPTESGQSESFLATGLAPATSYSFALRAYDNVGNLGPLPPLARVATLQVAPTAPDGLTADAESHESIRIAWNDLDETETAYLIERSGTGGPDFLPLATLLGSFSGRVEYLDAGLPDRTQYLYRVRTRNARGDSEPSAEATARTPLTPPTALTVTTLSPTSLGLAWSFASPEPPDSFRVETAIEGIWSTIGRTFGNERAYIDDRLTPATTHTYRVRAIAGFEASAPSNEASGTTDDAAPVCRLSTEELDFGPIVIGETGSAQFTVTNDGGGTLSGSFDAACGPFTVQGETTFSLGRGVSQEFAVLFTPTVVGPTSCGVTVSPSCPALTLQGVGVAAASCALDATALDFGPVGVGAASVRVVVLTNEGGVDLEGELAQIEGCPEFTIDNKLVGPFSLAPAGQLSIEITYRPTNEGTDLCEWTPSTGCVAVSLSGFGQAVPVCVLSETSLPFGAVTVGQTITRTFTIRNGGGGTLRGRVEKSTGAECADFQIEAGGGDFALSPTAPPRSVRVAYAPAAFGEDVCSILLGTDCGSLTATGEGTGDPVCTITPSLAALGFVGLDVPQLVEFVVENTGGGTLICDPSESCSSAFEFIEGFEPFTLAAGETHPLTVRFTATAETTYECAFFVTPDCAAEITAQGLGALCVLEPPALHFGNVGVDFPQVLDLVVRNIGGAVIEGQLTWPTCDSSIVVIGISSSYTLFPGEQQAFAVQFTPEMVGHELSCTMLASDCGSIPITGTGAHIDIQPAVVDVGPVIVFGVGQQTITFTNLSNFPMTFSIEDDPFDDFSIDVNSVDIEVGASVDRTLFFTPTSEGFQSATFLTNTYPASFEVQGFGFAGAAAAPASSPSRTTGAK